MCNTLLGLDPWARESYPLVKLLATSGMRLSEATNIKWGAIDFERDHFVVSGGEVGTKNRQIRTVPLFPAMRKFLESTFDLDEVPRDEYLFKFMSAIAALDTASRIAGLPRFTHHCLRPFFVSNAIEKGIDFKTIANWIGHKDGGLLVAKTYGHLRDSHSHEMAKLMD